MRNLAACSLILLSSLAFAATPAVKTAHKTTHKIKITALGGGGGSCSATAIAPHAILTASHCQAPSATIEVDGKDAEIAGTLGDGLDHTIYLLKNVTFKDYAKIADNVNAMEQGDDIFIFGNPGDLLDVYRKGYIAGYMKNEDEDDDDSSMILGLLLGGKKPVKKPSKKAPQPRVTLYDFNGFFGDSGSGIFNDKGEIVGVTSFIMSEAHDVHVMKYMGAYELRISNEELQMAQNYSPSSPSMHEDSGNADPFDLGDFIKKP